MKASRILAKITQAAKAEAKVAVSRDASILYRSVASRRFASVRKHLFASRISMLLSLSPTYTSYNVYDAYIVFVQPRTQATSACRYAGLASASRNGYSILLSHDAANNDTFIPLSL